jgi:hypothetical protein
MVVASKASSTLPRGRSTMDSMGLRKSVITKVDEEEEEE